MKVEQPGLLFGWPPLATEDNSYALLVRNRPDDDGGRELFNNFVRYLIDLWRFFGHPAVLISAGLALGTLVLLMHLIRRRPGADGRTPWAVAHDQGVPAATIFASLDDGGRWRFALTLFLGIYLVFFTAFFTNLLGAISGVTGSLLYWLSQHNVQRGGQPAHYYLFQLGVYEPLLLIFGTLGFALIARDLWRRRLAFPILLAAWWTLAALGLYAWAGEKMPWLTIHLVLPLTLLAAWAAQRVIWKEEEDGGCVAVIPARAPFILYATLFSAIVGLGLVLMTAIIGFGAASILAPWVVPLATLLLVGLLTTGAALRWGWRPAFALLAVCLGAALGLANVRATVRLAYVNGDVPVESMVYTQTSPDVLRLVQRIEEVSIRRGHGLDMPIIYDNETVWNWYFRNFTNVQRNAGMLDGPPGPEVMAVFMLQENLDQNPENRAMLDGFVIQRYPLRWWFPEDQVYRLSPTWRDVPLEQASLLAQLLRDPLNRTVEERWWRFLMFRDPGAPLGSTDFVIAVRPELARQLGVGLGGTLKGQPDE